MRLRLVLFSVLLLLPCVVAAAETAKHPVRVQTVQADFEQEKHLKILLHPVRSSGRFVFQAPGSLRWEYIHPFHSVLLLHDGQVKKFVEHDGQLRQDRTSGFDAMGVILGEISGWLEGKFTDTPTFTVQPSGKGNPVLIPRDPGMRGFIQQIVLEPGDRPGLLKSVTIVEGADSFTRMIFSNPVLNRPVDRALFTEP
jgi:outer membrane lipoprotein-sorting protein